MQKTSCLPPVKEALHGTYHC